MIGLLVIVVVTVACFAAGRRLGWIAVLLPVLPWVAIVLDVRPWAADGDVLGSRGEAGLFWALTVVGFLAPWTVGAVVGAATRRRTR